MPTLPGARRDGGTLRARLIALVLVPLLGVLGFAAVQVSEKLATARDATRTQVVVRTSAELSRASAALLREQLPDLIRGASRDPRVSAALGIRPGSNVGALTDAEITRLRRTSDARLADLAADPTTARTGLAVAAKLRRLRMLLDSLAGPNDGQPDFRPAVAQLIEAQRRQADAIPIGSSATTSIADADLQGVVALTRSAQQEPLALTGIRFPAVRGSANPRLEALDGWSQYRADVSAVTTASNTGPIADAVRAALSTTAAKRFDAGVARLVNDPASFTGPQALTLLASSRTRNDALSAVLQFAVDRSLSAAMHQHSTAVTSLWTTILITSLLLMLCVVLAWATLRSIVRPLDRLARSARDVSEGVLDDVDVDGPHEVRTVARGLSAAVASLRNIETQAAVVASGDLENDAISQPLPGPLGAVVHASVETIIAAIRERDAAKTDLAYRAAHDTLTELPNRAQAMQLIDQALRRAQRTGSMTGLMFVDLDRFKLVNDNHGHDAGDAVLRVVSRRMQAAVRTGDVVCRLGGDEFVVLLEHTDHEASFVTLAERIIDAVSVPIELDSGPVRIGASVGVAVCRDAEVDGARFLAEADAAAYRAKAAGRGRVGIFDDELRNSLARQAELEHAISSGLRAGEFVLHYQPVVELRTGRPIGFEALIRWNRPGHGTVAPDDFIPAAEASALIIVIGRWTLEEATRQLAHWDATAEHSELTMAVNISGRHLASDQLLPDVRAALAASGIDPRRLIVEITETMLINDDPLATCNLVDLRAMGVQVAIDDFGTGYTSLGQLPRLPVDSLKIDRSFVSSTDPAHRELVHLIVAAAHAFDLTVVAEGIESPREVAELNDLDVETGQGFFFARPQPAGDAIELARQPMLPDRAGFELALALPRERGPRRADKSRVRSDEPAATHVA